MVPWGHEGHVRAGGEHQAAKEPTAPWHGNEACQLGCTGVFAAGCLLWVSVAAAVGI